MHGKLVMVMGVLVGLIVFMFDLPTHFYFVKLFYVNFKLARKGVLFNL